jgi:hypothetical protein
MDSRRSATAGVSLVTRWGGYEELFAEKWVGVPVLFLRLYQCV